MPIRKANAAFYTGPEYEAFRELLRARAGDRCEACHAKNGETLFIGLEPRKMTVIQCGVSHTDFDPRHRDPERARWLCRRCHLAWDRRNNVARRRRLRDQANGQAWLDEDVERAEMPEGNGAVHVSVDAVSPEGNGA